MASLEHLIRSWRASESLHSLRECASVEEIEVFEEEAGWRLPTEWRELYAYTNGAILFKDNLRIYPLFGDDMSLLEGSQSYRHNDWPVPDELWIAGSDGEGNPFGLWLPAATREVCPVVKTEPIFNSSGCLAIAGSSLKAFLLLRTVYFLLLYRDEASPDAAFAVLNVPREVRSIKATNNDLAWAAIALWADPECLALLDPPDEGYLQRLTAREVSRRLGCIH